MEILEQLGVALGLASLAGVNLYLTVLLTGTLVRFDLLHLAEKHEALLALGHPVVLAVAGVLFVLEFFADKVPWVDSLWDSLHTVIRPVGGTLIALQALGDMAPQMQVVAGLLAGGAALTTHSAKAGTRLLINSSPEPVTNAAMSVTEDVAVVAGGFLVLLKPVIALVVFALLLVVLWMVMPRIWAVIRTSVWLVWMKLRMPGHREAPDGTVQLGCEVDGDLLALLAARAGVSEHEIAWTARCITGKSKGIKGLRPNLRATLVGRKTGAPMLVVKRRGLRDVVQELSADGSSVEVESRLLSENLAYQREGVSLVLRFPRGEAQVAETVAMQFRRQGSSAASTIDGPVDEPDEGLAPVMS